MSRALLAGVALLVLLSAAAWFAASPSRKSVPLAPGAAVAPTAAAPTAANGPEEIRPEVDTPMVARAEAAVERKAALSASEEELARARWVEGRVMFPAGTPLDEEAFVIADGRDFGDGSDHRARVGPDGSFRVAFSEASRSGTLRLEARYLFLPEPTRWKRKEPGPIVLEPRLGGRITARVLPPTGLTVAGLGGEVRISQVQPHSGFVVFGDGRGSRSLGADGELAFGGLEPEREYALDYDGERCVGESAAVTAVAGRTVPVDLPLEMGLSISGRVLDESGAPLEGASLTAHPGFNAGVFRPQSFRHAQSAADGTYRLGAMERAVVELNVRHDGFEPFEVKLEPSAGLDVLERDVVLKRGHSVSGTVSWPDGSPAEAWLRLSPWPESRPNSDHRDVDGRAAADGTFAISGLTAGSYHVRAWGTKVTEVPAVSAVTGRERVRKERALWSAEIERVDVGAHGLELVLGPGLSVRGTVRDASGAALDDFRVTARRTSFPGNPGDEELQPSERFRDTHGAFELTGLQPGRWALRASAKDRVASDAVELELPGEATVEFTLEREAVVRGKVLDASGAPAAEIDVRAMQPDRAHQIPFDFDGDELEDETDRDGEFQIDGLVGGRTLLVASSPGGVPGEPFEVQLVAGQTLEGVTLQLVPGGHLEGEVVDRDGRPDGELHVWIRSLERDFNTTVDVDREGRFSGRDLPPGKLRVHATTAEGLSLQAEVEIRVGQTARVRLAPPDTAPVRLTGRVLAAGEPIAGARVSARLESAQPGDPASRVQNREETDEQGRYALVLPGSGRWLVSVQGYASNSGFWTAPLDVPQVAELRHDLVLALCRISGRVTGPGGEPVAQAQVRSEPRRHDGGPRGSAFAMTDEEGRYELVLPAGEHAVVAGGEEDRHPSADGRSWAPARVDGLRVNEGEHRTGVDLRLIAGGTLAGVVRGPSGAAWTSATLYWGDGATLQWIGRSDELGEFRIDGLAPGTRWLRAIDERAATASALSVTIRAGEETRVELALAPAVSARVRVLDAAGAPLGCEIEAFDADGRAVPQQSGGEQGSVRLGPLTPGRYRVVARREDKRTERAFEVTALESEIEIVLGFE